MQSKGIIVVRNRKASIPDAFLEKVLEQYPSCHGAAFAHEGELFVSTLKGVPDIEGLKDQLQNILGDYTVVLSFEKYPDGFLEDNIQPTVIMGTQKSPLMVGFVEGNFENYSEEGSRNSDVFFFTQKMLVPQAQSMFSLMDGNWDKLMAAFQNDHQKKVILNGIEDGRITLLDHKGEIITFGAGEEGKKFDWGYASQTLGYKEESYPASEVKTEATKPRLFDRFKGKAKDVPQTKPQPTVSTTKSSAPDVKVVDAADAGGKTDTAAVVSTVLIPKDIYWAAPPQEIIKQSNKAVKAWYKNNCGSTPNNWNTYPKVQLAGKAKRNAETKWLTKNGYALDSKLEVVEKLPQEKEEQVNTEVQNDKPVTSVPVTNQMTEKLKEIKPKVIASTEAIKQDPPVPSTAEKKAVEEIMIHALDSNSKTMADPEQFQKWETKHSTFTETHGINLIDLMGTEFKTFEKLCKLHPISAAQLITEALCAWYKLVPAEAKQHKPDDKPAEVEPKTQTSNTPKVNSMMSRFRKAS